MIRPATRPLFAGRRGFGDLFSDLGIGGPLDPYSDSFDPNATTQAILDQASTSIPGNDQVTPLDTSGFPNLIASFTGGTTKTTTKGTIDFNNPWIIAVGSGLILALLLSGN
jgi:hypothetical protein